MTTTTNIIINNITEQYSWIENGHRVQNGHAQVIARNKKRKEKRLYLLIERHREQQNCYYESSTHIIFVLLILICRNIMCRASSLSFLCPLLPLARPFSFHQVQLFPYMIFLISSIPCLVVYYRFDDECWIHSDTHSQTHTPIWPKWDGWAIRFMIIWKKFISTRFRYEFTNVLISSHTYGMFSIKCKRCPQEEEKKHHRNLCCFLSHSKRKLDRLIRCVVIS